MFRAATTIIPLRDGHLPLGVVDALAVAADNCRVLLVSNSDDDLSELARVFAADEIASRVTLVAVSTFEIESIADVLVSYVPKNESAVFPASPDGRDIAIALAARLGRRYFPFVIYATDTQVSVPRLGSQLQADIDVAAPYIATAQPSGEPLAEDVGSEPGADIVLDTSRVDNVVTLAMDGVSTVEIELPNAAELDLHVAPRIVGAGAGMIDGDDSVQHFERLRSVGAALGASLGATRVVTDAGYVHHDRQIGSTGVMVNPELYISFGVSGAVQHTVGLGSPVHTISVNTDSHCPMMQRSTVAIVSDANKVIVRLGELLEKHEVAVLPRDEVSHDD